MKRLGVVLLSCALALSVPLTSWARVYPAGDTGMSIDINDTIAAEHDKLIREFCEWLGDIAGEDAVGKVVNINRVYIFTDGSVELIMNMDLAADSVVLSPTGSWDLFAEHMGMADVSIRSKVDRFLMDSAAKWAQQYHPEGGVHVIDYDAEKQIAIVL